MCTARALLAIKGLAISADLCPLSVLFWLKHAFRVWSCKWGSGAAEWMQMLSQSTASPCSGVSKHFPGHWRYFMSWFIGCFPFSVKQFQLVRTIPSPPPLTLMKIPPIWSQSCGVYPSSPDVFSRFICQSSCDGCSVYLIFYTKVELFFPEVWQWLGTPPVCVLLLQHCWVPGNGGQMLGLKAAPCGRCFGSAQGWRCW